MVTKSRFCIVKGKENCLLSEIATGRTARGTVKNIQIGWVFMKLYAAGYVAEIDVKSLFLSSIKSLLKSAFLPNVFDVRFSQGNTKKVFST